MFRGHYRLRHGIYLFTIVILGETFPTVSLVTQMEIVCKRCSPWKLTGQLTTSRFTKLFEFNLHIQNRLLRNHNGHCMEVFFPREVDVPTYQFEVHKTTSISSSRVIFRVHYISSNV